MNKKTYRRAALLHAAWELVPPLIRETLSEDAQFRKEHSITLDAVITFDGSGISFQRSAFYDAVRKCMSSKVELSDKNGRNWEIKNISKKLDLPRVSLSNGKQRLVVADMAVLSPDSIVRLRYLDEVASSINLPRGTREEWRGILLERPLEDDEVDAFHRECSDTPVEQVKSMCNVLEEEHINVSSLVPNSRKYYERLVGNFNGSASINDYAASSCRTFFEQLSSWRPYDGFLFSLLLSSHTTLTAEIDVSQLDREELVRAYEFIEDNGDVISQLGAIEVGLRVIALRPEIEPILIRLIERLRDDDVNAKDSGFNLIATLFVLVDGELSRVRLFTKEPPFYRRLAAFSQAALIYRQIINSSIDIGPFREWVFNNRGGQYYLQSLADMRLEPCWNPDFASASQMKADFLERIMIVARNCQQSIATGQLYDLLFSTSSESISSFCKFPYSYYPGPLEGGEDTPKILHAEVSKEIETQLSAEEVSFIALVNSAMIFRIGTDQAELASKALKRCGYRLTNVKNRSQILAILNGLATVAAITRSHTLADELRILVRIYRRDSQCALSAKEAMRTCLIAAASRKNLKEWRDFTGEWMTEIAFGDLKDDDGEVLYSHLRCLCHVVPELWISCGRAEAALAAYNARAG